METELNLKATELRLGLPGTQESDSSKPLLKIISNKRQLKDSNEEINPKSAPPPAKSQIVGWPPIRSYRKNTTFQGKISESEGDDDDQGSGINYVKVSMDGAPYLRKIDIKCYKGYHHLLKALENMFKLKMGVYSEREGYKGSDYAPTYEDKDGDWMLVGDVPWDMFLTSCKRLRIMKGSDAKGLGSGESLISAILPRTPIGRATLCECSAT
ncbi:auxin-responsive protein IAA4-like [Rutidosis leptorrhynchoides]|uniref:auxin-responsive protein IAA4-like n=1 Tax=Rutidosis leptorrhynchoides TaxID=125765 RepID=UPI003A9A1316